MFAYFPSTMCGVEVNNLIRVDDQALGATGPDSSPSGCRSEDALNTLCKTLKLSTPQQIALAVGLAQSTDPKVAQVGGWVVHD